MSIVMYIVEVIIMTGKIAARLPHLKKKARKKRPSKEEEERKKMEIKRENNSKMERL